MICDSLRAMMHCPKCRKSYSDASLNFCLEDGSQLTFFDTEAETLKNQPPNPEMSEQDAIMELIDYLNSLRRKPGVQSTDGILVRFQTLTNPRGLTLTQVSDNFEAAADKAGFIVLEKTDLRASVRLKPPPARTVKVVRS
jgi:hypothetical protein